MLVIGTGGFDRIGLRESTGYGANTSYGPLIDNVRLEIADGIPADVRSGMKVLEGSSSYDNNKDSTQGTTNGPSTPHSNSEATLAGALGAAGVALVVAAVAWKMKRSLATASSQQSVESDEASVPSLQSTV